MKQPVSDIRFEVDRLAVFDDHNPILFYAMNCVKTFISERLYGEDSHKYVNDLLQCAVTVNYKRGNINVFIESVRK